MDRVIPCQVTNLHTAEWALDDAATHNRIFFFFRSIRPPSRIFFGSCLRCVGVSVCVSACVCVLADKSSVICWE